MSYGDLPIVVSPHVPEDEILVFTDRVIMHPNQGVLFSDDPYRKTMPMPILKRFLSVKPDFVRLLNTLFAVTVAFELVTVTTEQFAIVVLAVEALFQYLSKVAFGKDVEELASS